jgi:two-component system, LytTR family, response regulator
MIRTLVVDDIPLARQRVIRVLLEHPDVEVVGEAYDGESMLLAIDNLRPELVILDVSMPGSDGMAALLKIQEQQRPFVVFVTAHSQYAVRAFRLNAIDYLVKPLDSQALACSLERVRERIGSRQVEATPGPPSDPRQAFFKTLDGVKIVSLEEVLWLEAVRNYVAVHVRGETLIVRSTFRALLAGLDPAIFVRIHRSTAVNIQQVEHIQPTGNGDQKIRLRNGQELTVSRTFRLDLLKSW